MPQIDLNFLSKKKVNCKIYVNSCLSKFTILPDSGYVDDLLLCSDSDEVEKVVEETIGAVVPLKETGKIKKAAQGGGALTFIGRHIFRDGHKNDLKLGVDPKFLDAVFKEFNISKGSAAIPDVAAHIEKTVDDVNAQVPLSAEAYARFRRALGKLLWMAQVRHDIKIYLSLIGSQQAAPMSGTETAIRSILRFLYNGVSTMLSIPSPEYFEHACPGWDEVGVVHAFSDASHAPYRFNGRRSITGGSIFVEGTLIKTTAKQQQSVALSSCEAELYALQSVSQEAIALSTFCMRIYAGLEECTRETTGYVVMESDSESALTLIAGKDVPKKSRHIEIRLHWMRSKIESEELALKYKPGTDNCADMFTKCLSTKDFVKHRATLGFAQHEVPVGDLNSLREILLTGVSASVGQEMAFIEVCCSENSSLRQACKVARMPYLGITKNMQERRVLDEVKAFVVVQRNCGRWLHVHCSTPCSSGSPLKHWNQKRDQTEADRDWHSIIGSAEAYLTLGDSRSFELPKHNQIWQRPETQRILERCGLNYDAEVALCQTGLWSMMREHRLESVWNSLQHLLALQICSQRSLEPVHADFMRNSTPSIGIAQAITARRWQRPFWQRRGPPEGNLADRAICMFVLEFMWSKHKELRLHFLWNVLSWPMDLYLLEIFHFISFAFLSEILLWLSVFVCRFQLVRTCQFVRFCMSWKQAIFDFTWYLCDVPVHAYIHVLVMVRWQWSPYCSNFTIASLRIRCYRHAESWQRRWQTSRRCRTNRNWSETSTRASWPLWQAMSYRRWPMG